MRPVASRPTSLRAGRLTLAAAAALVTVAPGAGPAAAAASWTVTPGGQFTGHAGTTKLKDTTDGNSLTCSNSALRGVFKAGNGLSGTSIGSITSGGKFTGCSGPLPFPVSVTFRGLPWHISVSAYRSGVVHGTISHIEITVSLPGGCRFTLDGTAAGAFDGAERFAYTDPTHTLKLVPAGGNLHFYKVGNCAHLVHNGDSAAYAANYTLTPAQAITSP